MISPYTTAAAKLLTKSASVEIVRIFPNCIQVTYWRNGGRCSTFLSKSAFHKINFRVTLSTKADDKESNKSLAQLALSILPMQFGWGEVPEVSPFEIYYKTHRIQVWKLPTREWGMHGHFLLIDTYYQKILTSADGNAKHTWTEIDKKRSDYLKILPNFDKQISHKTSLVYACQ